jgi:hypothetical protein
MTMEDKTLKIINTIAAVFLALATTFGLIFIFLDLQEFRVQNESLNIEVKEISIQNLILEKTLKQNYRPVGVAKLADNDSLFIVQFARSDSIGKINIVLKPKLYNMGKGVLSLIGHISYCSYEKIDFRSKLLNGEIENFSFDYFREEARGKPIMQNEYWPIIIEQKNLPIENIYYIYSLIFYKDQDGNLYDTERLDLIDCDSTITMEDNWQRPVLSNKNISNEQYNYYKVDEIQKLENLFKKKGHNLANYVN